MEIINNNIPIEMEQFIDFIKAKYSEEPKVAEMFEAGFKNTYQTTIRYNTDGKTFVITGDIPAMWNRDSCAQVRPLLHIVNECREVKEIIKGVIETQKDQVIRDPYANAHNLEPRVGEHSGDDLTEMDSLVWERKYEVDSLCYPLQLAYLYWKKTGDSTIFDEKFLTVAQRIVRTFRVEQNHPQNSEYSFRRIADWLLFGEPERIPFETLPNRGKGSEVAVTGMTWSGFRPSDDACKFGYLIPSNMFAVVVLGYLSEIVKVFYPNETSFNDQVTNLRDEIEAGIQNYGIVNHEKYGKIYAYEVDGFGNSVLMDDANVPSLLSLPYLGYCDIDDPIYINTRNFVLSEDNPYYFKGKVASGVGSPHTPDNHFWHIALAIEGLTTRNRDEQQRILELFKATDANTGLMHEGVDVDDPTIFTRPWFSWANAMFAEFILYINDIELE